jgi:chaperone required for assembly of F1-ATPase
MKRFYTSVSVDSAGSEHRILLDEKPIRTPLKSILCVPTAELAHAIAAEWGAQATKINPATMPLTRHANTALDRVKAHRGAILKEIGGFGESDLLCYRATDPDELISAQAAAWDPLLAWSAKNLKAPLNIVHGIMHQSQAAQSLASLRRAVLVVDDWQVSPLHTLVSISGSLVIGLAVLHKAISADAAWAAAQVDALYQTAKWGIDDEAQAVAQRRHHDMIKAAEFLALL